MTVGREPATRLLLALPYLAYGVLVPVLKLVVMALVVDPSARPGHFEDDSFYYFRIAENVVSGDGSTFNGLDPTNGYHPLWLALLVPVFAVAEGLAALVWVQALQALLWALAMLAAWRLARRTGLEVPLALGLLPLVIVGALTGASTEGLYFSGMEAILTLVAVLFLVDATVAGNVLGPGPPPLRTTLVVGGLLALLVAARLDAAFVGIAYVVAAFVGWRGTDLRVRLTRAAALAAPAAAFGLAYLAFNALHFDSALPVSGRAKALGELDVSSEPLRYFLSLGYVRGVQLNLGTAALLLTAVALLLRQPSPAARLRRSLVVVFAGLCLQVAYSSVSLAAWPVWPWYAYLVPVVLALAIALLVSSLQRERGWSPRPLATIGCVIVGVALAPALLAVAVNRGDNVPFQEDVLRLTERAAALADRSTPPDAVLAMGDRAGSFGYFLDRPLVQLEGLADSPKLLDALERRTVPELLRQRRVAFVVISNDGTSDEKLLGSGPCSVYVQPKFGTGPKSRLVLCRADKVFEIRDVGQFYAMWRYRPERQPSGQS